MVVEAGRSTRSAEVVTREVDERTPCYLEAGGGDVNEKGREDRSSACMQCSFSLLDTCQRRLSSKDDRTAHLAEGGDPWRAAEMARELLTGDGSSRLLWTCWCGCCLNKRGGDQTSDGDGTAEGSLSVM